MAARRKKAEQQTESYKYGSASRKNLPTEQTEAMMGAQDKRPVPFTPEVLEFDEQPRLAWARSSRVDEDGNPKPYEAHPLYVREKIAPHLFVEQLKSGRGADVQGSMFEAFNGLPEASALDWYRHDGNWQNRLIHGESLRVMASLAEREGLAGQVQLIYFDPPYGMGYKSNFQVSVDDLGTAENRKGLPSDPKTIAAFRDTYKYGIHSYLDGVYERLVVCRELLAETGSIFVQIGDENVLRMGILLDEVFGAENRVSMIPYITSGASSASTLSSVADFLLWYAKDKGQGQRAGRYHQLYEPLDRAGKVEHMSSYVMVELADGTTRNLTAEERSDPDAHLPAGARLYRRMPLTSMGTSTTGHSDSYFWQEADWPCPPGRHWSVSMEGMDRLADLGRLDVAGPDSVLGWKRYEEELAGSRIHNVWQQQMSAKNKRYVVQTANLTIQRAILMATNPGDLVLDPTCGGATTAFVAEQWGRRWITIDTSPVATAIARQRIATATFPYYTLAGSLKVPRQRPKCPVCRCPPRLPAGTAGTPLSGSSTSVSLMSAPRRLLTTNTPIRRCSWTSRTSRAAPSALLPRSPSRARPRGHTSPSTTQGSPRPYRRLPRLMATTRQPYSHTFASHRSVAGGRGGASMSQR